MFQKLFPGLIVFMICFYSGMNASESALVDRQPRIESKPIDLSAVAAHVAKKTSAERNNGMRVPADYYRPDLALKRAQYCCCLSAL